MLRYRDKIRLRHMLDHARMARRMIEGRQRADLDRDETMRLALTRAIEVIGEAAARVSDSTRQRLSQIQWRQIIGTRHRLIHGYDTVDLDILWRIANEDLPPLIALLQAVIDAG